MVSLPEENSKGQFYHDEHLVVDFLAHVATLDDKRLALTHKEYDLLEFLVQHAGEVVPRKALLMQIWGYEPEIRTRTLDVHIQRLRKKLEPYASRYIETIVGIGYRFEPFPGAPNRIVVSS